MRRSIGRFTIHHSYSKAGLWLTLEDAARLLKPLDVQSFGRLAHGDVDVALSLSGRLLAALLMIVFLVVGCWVAERFLSNRFLCFRYCPAFLVSFSIHLRSDLPESDLEFLVVLIPHLVELVVHLILYGLLLFDVVFVGHQVAIRVEWLVH